MSTELSFLVELLLNHKLTKPTKDLIASRIKEVESSLSTPMIRASPRVVAAEPAPLHQPTTINPIVAQQSPSTQALMMAHPELIPPMPKAATEEQSVAVIAQTPAAMQAMASRTAAITAAMKGKVDPATGGKRKF